MCLALKERDEVSMVLQSGCAQIITSMRMARAFGVCTVGR